MSEIYLFWDKENDTPEILGEDGEFYSYGEDNVAIERNESGGRYWVKMNKFTDVTPLNNWVRYEVFDPLLDYWVSWDHAREDFVNEVHRHAGNMEAIF